MVVVKPILNVSPHSHFGQHVYHGFEYALNTIEIAYDFLAELEQNIITKNDSVRACSRTRFLSIGLGSI